VSAGLELKRCAAVRAIRARVVAYPRPADKYLGPLVSRLSGVNQPVIRQPVIRTRNAFSTPRLTPLAYV